MNDRPWSVFASWSSPNRSLDEKPAYQVCGMCILDLVRDPFLPVLLEGLRQFPRCFQFIVFILKSSVVQKKIPVVSRDGRGELSSNSSPMNLENLFR